MWLKFSYDRSHPKERSSGLRRIFENTTSKDDVIVRMTKYSQSQEVVDSYVEAFLHDVWVQTEWESEIFLGAVDEDAMMKSVPVSFVLKPDGRILSPFLASQYGYSTLQTETSAPRDAAGYLTFYQAKGGDANEIDRVEEAFDKENGYRDIEASPDSGPDGWVVVKNDAVLHGSTLIGYNDIFNPKSEIENFREVSSFLEYYKPKSAPKGILGLYENAGQIVVYESRQFVSADNQASDLDAVGVYAMGPKRSFWFSAMMNLHICLEDVVRALEDGGWVDGNTKKAYYSEIATNPGFLAKAVKENGKYSAKAADLALRVFRAADNFLAGKPAALKNVPAGTKDFKLVSCPAGFKFLKNTRRKITLNLHCTKLQNAKLCVCEQATFWEKLFASIAILTST